MISRFLEYKNYVETWTGQKIKVLQSDNGKKFCNAAIDEALKRFEIRHQLSTPYTPQQNGVVERKNRTLVKSARCILTESGLSDNFLSRGNRYSKPRKKSLRDKDRCLSRRLPMSYGLANDQT